MLQRWAFWMLCGIGVFVVITMILAPRGRPCVYVVNRNSILAQDRFRSCLTDYLETHGYDLAITSEYPSDSSRIQLVLVENPGPEDQLFAYPYCKRAAILWEPPSVEPCWCYYGSGYLDRIALVFTWDDNLVDGNKYCKIWYQAPETRPALYNKIPWDQRKLVTMINWNKGSRHPNELYSKRRDFIWHCIQHAPHDFDLYGYNWSMWEHTKPVYRGSIEDKLNTLCRYKFTIAYENICKTRGYVSEKILDAMWASCVPVYWGSDNITDYIPVDCFIDRRQFASEEELYIFLRDMNYATYQKYIEAIDRFISSPSAQIFSLEACVDQIGKCIVQYIEKRY